MSIIIIGSGVTGATLALAISNLSNGKMPVDIIEQIDPTLDVCIDHFEKKTIALSAGTCQKLSDICLWQLLKNFSTPITNIYVSEKNNFGSLLFNAQDHAIPALGYSVELNTIKKKIFCLLKKSDGINLHCPSSVLKITYNKKNIEVLLNTGNILYGKLLVLSSGYHYPEFFRYFDITCKIKNYHQFAVVSNVKSQIPHNNCAFEYFTGNGVIALLPIKSNIFSIIWCFPIKNQTIVTNWSDQEFLYHLQLTFGWKLGKFLSIEKRYIYPLTLKIPNKIIYYRTVLTGNAAQTVHPIAGQGLNIGLRDVFCLSKILTQCYFLKKDPGEFLVLKKYEYLRRYDRKIIIYITDKLVEIFNNKSLLMILGRNFGLDIINNVSFIKKFLSKKMLGFF